MDMQMLDKGAHGAEIRFSSTNVDNYFIATLAKGVHLRALNVDPEAAWLDEGFCLDITNSNVDVRIKVGVDGQLNSV